MVVTPLLVYGTIFGSDGSTPSASNTVTLLYESTGEILSTTTDASGHYILDLANLSADYVNGDYFRVTATGSSSSTNQVLKMKIKMKDIVQVSRIRVRYNE